jgi:hypothetical protein
MRRIGLAVVLGVSFLAAPLAVHGQQAGPPTLALLFLGTAGIDSTERSDIAVREGLREHGWVENQNIRLQHRYADGMRDRLDQLAGELVKNKVDVIVTIGTEATRAARRAGLSRSHLVRGADALIVTVRHLERFSPTARSAARIYGHQPLLIGIQGRPDVVDKLKAALGQALDLAS